ncbi:MAG: hypothetical protein IPP97_06340 [Candidatus Obscuribacter sp.]|nr:hypothetical protein [Candidatus Obscuribacter sp.]
MRRLIETRLFAMACLSVMAVLPGFTQNSTGPASGESSVAIREVSDFKSLPLLKAKSIRMSFADQSYEDGKHFAYLEGVVGAKVVWKKPVLIPEDLNLAKTDVTASGHQITIISQLPFSAAYTSLTYTFDGDKVKLIATEHGDPSREVVDQLKSLATSGTRSAFDRFAKGDNSIMYPGQYVHRDAIETLLAAGHKAALKDFEAGRVKQALERLEIAFDASYYLVSLNEDLPGCDGKSPVRWLEAWTTSAIAMPAADWAPRLNDYGYFLQKLGRNKEAITVFETVIKDCPERTAAYLNLADSLYKVGSPKSARANYELYSTKMAKEGKKAQIPARVLERIN